MDKDEEIIIPKKSSKVPSTSRGSESVAKKGINKPLLITLVIACIFIVVLVVAIIILVNKNSDSSLESAPEESESTVEDIEILYTTPDGVEDAKTDYQDWLESQKDAAKTDGEVFDAELRIIANLISDAEYDEAASRLEDLSIENRSAAELFRYCNVYTRLYEETGDTEKFNEYVDLRTEQLNILAAEESGENE